MIPIRFPSPYHPIFYCRHNINAQLDLDIYVLDHMDIEAVEVMENNNW